MNPKMGKIDIDYSKLSDAFFKYQTKPLMTEHGDIYYEGKDDNVRSYSSAFIQNLAGNAFQTNCCAVLTLATLVAVATFTSRSASPPKPEEAPELDETEIVASQEAMDELARTLGGGDSSDNDA